MTETDSFDVTVIGAVPEATLQPYGRPSGPQDCHR
jgi:hypothetical protein